MHSIKITVLLGILALTLSGCTSLKSDYNLLQTENIEKAKQVKVSDRSIEYRILPQDRLKIVLYKDPEQGGVGEDINGAGILVNTSGFIMLPLIGQIKVAGMTQTEAAKRITNEYKQYLNTPSVYLEVMNKRLFVLGEVRSQGVIKIDKEKMTLFEAIAQAGGLTDSAIRDNILIVTNTSSGGVIMRSVDLTNFDKIDFTNLMLRPNDIVYVQPDNLKKFRLAADSYIAPFETIVKAAQPFVTIKYLLDR